ncbi:hypothetical protein JMUB7532_27540 [Staphylococcus aureus]
MSRGLGDVYKRQLQASPRGVQAILLPQPPASVSYTHLTLPTTSRV